jgi:N-6 DNA Methylase
MFQAVLETGREDAKKFAAARRELGAHYTSERNILRALGPLFLDELKAELEAAKRNKARLQALHERLAGIRLLDPACGCGNFLVVAFQQLRLLEIELVHRLHGDATKSRGLLDMRDLLRVQVDQFYGIEIDASAAHIARVALWITDHQMNLVAAQRLGQARPSVPLTHSATIAEGNALRLDWATVLPPGQCSYVVGNPPFVGAKFLNDAQREDVALAFGDLKNAGLLDLVAAWYVKAARYIQTAPAVRAAFVSTNSITQGEQVGVLWGWMLAQGMKIQFAHRTFQWSNDAQGVAAVHCVIVGFGAQDRVGKRLFEYPDIKSEPVEVAARNINPYLVDAPDVVLPRRSTPLCAVPGVGIGNKPIDGGHYLFTTEERDEFLRIEPDAARFFRRWIGADEFLNGYERWCLWLGHASPVELRALPECRKRIQAVRDVRLASKSAPTRKLADTPTRFHVENIPAASYMVLPKVSSARRMFIPFGFEQPTTFSSDLVFVLADASVCHFGFLSSTMHNAWVRATCGRMKSDYRYSAAIVYNNYPWPGEPLADKQRIAIETAAQAVLAARAVFQDSSLADLYDPLTMPSELRKAHQKLDKAVDAAYGYTGKPDDTERVAFLFGRYQQLVDSEASVKKK